MSMSMSMSMSMESSDIIAIAILLGLETYSLRSQLGEYWVLVLSPYWKITVSPTDWIRSRRGYTTGISYPMPQSLEEVYDRLLACWFSDPPKGIQKCKRT